MQFVIIMHVLFRTTALLIFLNAHSRVFTCNNSNAYIMLKYIQVGVPNLLGGGALAEKIRFLFKDEKVRNEFRKYFHYLNFRLTAGSSNLTVFS